MPLCSKSFLHFRVEYDFLTHLAKLQSYKKIGSTFSRPFCFLFCFITCYKDNGERAWSQATDFTVAITWPSLRSYKEAWLQIIGSGFRGLTRKLHCPLRLRKIVLDCFHWNNQTFRPQRSKTFCTKTQWKQRNLKPVDSYTGQNRPARCACSAWETR